MMPLVDGHLHLFKPHSEQYPRRVYDVMAEESREELAAELVRAMEANGVSHAVVVPLGNGDEYLREVIAAHPGRFAGVGLYDHESPQDVSVVRERCVSGPLQGLRFYGLNGRMGDSPTDLACWPILEFMAAKQLVLWFYGDSTQIAILRDVLRVLPELRVVLNHLGFLPDIHAEMQFDSFRRPRFVVELPPQGLVIVEEIAAEFQNVHAHFSGHYAFSREEYPFKDLVPVSRRLLDAFGPTRMLMATDWPWIREAPGYDKMLTLIDHHLPDLAPGDRASVCGGNALGLFDFSLV